ncbi:MAG TPA: FAD-dependent monooxygenase, partial [Acidimicrobiales bacterium]|nr:FAD-dependent monooxygenase [Acidimicrobiales bacterium]
MRIAVVGGGPGGLLAATLLKAADPRREVWVAERNGPEDTFGFGVVFSQETLDNLAAADPVLLDRIAACWRRWSAIDIHFRGRVTRSDGHQFAALARRDLLAILTARASEVGVEVAFHTEATDVAALARGHDLVVGADGVGSTVRAAVAPEVGPAVDRGRSKYMWLGTRRPVEVFTFLFVETPHGLVQAHVYPYSDELATFIVETDEATWARAGLAGSAEVPRSPGENDQEGIAFAEATFADYLGDYGLLGNNSRWLEFATVTNQVWHTGNVVLVGDAAHTAHFSVGSGTKLAMEDAITLAGAVEAALARGGDCQSALKEYEEERRPQVASTQRAAATSLR